MELYGKKDRSILQKSIILVLEVVIVALSYWILFREGYFKIFQSSEHIIGNEVRHILLFAFNLIVFVRICFTLFYFIKRHIPWEEVFSISMAFGLYYIGFALLGYKSQQDINFVDVFGIALFLFGSYLNTGSEISRHKWKKNPENKGKLYTIGLFKFSMHINFFGDLLWVCGYALVTRNWYSGLIVFFLFCFFAFVNIPKLDEYLASRYKEQFEDYKKRTKKFIPFIY